MKRSKGIKNKTRQTLRVSPRDRGKLKISDLLKELKSGDRVLIKPHPSHQVTIPHRRYFGLVGTVSDRKGSCYSVNVKMGSKIKELVISPAHLRLVK